MEYSELISHVLEDFYENGKDFPQDMLYPILCRNVKGKIVDLFLVCKITRDSTNGKIVEINDPIIIYSNEIKSQTGEFLPSFDISNAAENNIKSKHFNCEISVKEFTKYYMKVREFIFNNNLNKGQLDALEKLVAIYDKEFETQANIIYHKYGCSFFDWAYKMLKIDTLKD